MLHSNDQIIKHKVGLLNLAEELRNLSKAWQVVGAVLAMKLTEINRTSKLIEDHFPT